jgi:hypothetical protein
LDYQYTLKKKIIMPGGLKPVFSRGGHKKRVNEGEYGGCILYSYMNKRMKPVETVLRRGEEGE